MNRDHHFEYRCLALLVWVILAWAVAILPARAEGEQSPTARCTEADAAAGRVRGREDAEVAIAQNDYRLRCYLMSGAGGIDTHCGIQCAADLYAIKDLIRADSLGVKPTCLGWDFPVVSAYSFGYNARLLESPDFPDKDICRVPDAKIDYYEFRESLGDRAKSGDLPSRIDHLATAARYGLVDEVRRRLDAGEAVNAPDRLGLHAMQWAAARGYEDIVDLLLAKQAGAPPFHSYRTYNQQFARDPAELAARYGHLGIFKKLLTDEHLRHTPTLVGMLTEATKGGHIDIVKYLYDEREAVRLIHNSPGWMKYSLVEISSQLIHLATVRGHAPLVTEYLNRGADVETSGRILQGEASLLQSAMANQKASVVRVLLQRGAKTDANTLVYATYWGNSDVITAVLDHGADPNAPGTPDPQSRMPSPPHPPLFFAAGQCWKGYHKVPALISRGANPNVTDAKGSTALLRAVDGGMMSNGKISTGLNQNIRPDMPDAVPENLECIEELIAGGADVNQSDEDGNTALHFAARSDYHATTIALLLSKGAKAGTRNKAGETPHDVATKLGLVRVPQLLKVREP